LTHIQWRGLGRHGLPKPSLQEGLARLQPAKNHSFLVLVAGFAGNEHQK